MSEVRIYVLPHGHVIVGTEERTPEWRVVDGAVIRRWGTDAGLAQLAAKGPLTDKSQSENAPTVLEHGGRMEVPEAAIVFTFLCDEKAWKGKLPR